jgi:hypothetical protein
MVGVDVDLVTSAVAGGLVDALAPKAQNLPEYFRDDELWQKASTERAS